MEKLNQMLEKVQEKLADPDMYKDTHVTDRRTWQGKFAELEAAIPRAEALWLEASEALEKLEGRA